MKKLNLDVESLRVDSFYSTPELPRQGRGTVHGQGTTTIKIVADTTDAQCGITGYYTCTITEDPEVCATTDTGSGSNGPTVYGVSCGPPTSCGNGSGY